MKVREVQHTERFVLRPGLPPQLSEGKEGFDALCEILGVRTRDDKQAIVGATGVKRVLRAQGHSSPRGTRTAERLRLALLAFYSDPEARRGVWRFRLEHEGEVNDGATLIPSLEYESLNRYDDAVLTAERDPDALAECANLYAPDVSQEEWHAPALAALPRLRDDIANWESLAPDRRPLVLDAALAAATILDDGRLLQWASKQVDDIAEQFKFAHPEESPTEVPEGRLDETSDVLATLAGTANKLGATATKLAEQPTADLFGEVATLAADLAALREPVLARAVVDTVESLMDEFTCFLDEKSDVAAWLQTDEAIAAWRAAYPADSATPLEGLRSDIARAREDVCERLEDWAEARARVKDARTTVDQYRHAMDAKNSPSIDDLERRNTLSAELNSAEASELDAMKKVDAAARPKASDVRSEDGDTEAPETLSARATQQSLEKRKLADQSKKRTDLHPKPEKTHKAPPKSPPQKPTNRVIEPQGRASTTVTEPDTAGAVPALVEDAVGSTSESPPNRERDQTEAPADPTSQSQQGDAVVDGRTTQVLWEAVGNGRLGLAYHIAKLDPSDAVERPSPELLAAVALGMIVRGPDDDLALKYGQEIAPLLDTDFSTREQPARDALNLLLFSATLRPALFASQQGVAIPLLRRVQLSGGLAPVYRLANAVADQAEKLQGVRFDVSTLMSILDEAVWQDRIDAHFEKVAVWRSSAPSARFRYAPAGAVWRQWISRKGIPERIGRPDRHRSNCQRTSCQHH